MHTDLIKALGEFASASRMKGHMRNAKTRESILEQALVEQNEILDVMQDVIASLERENKFLSDKNEAQSKLIQNCVGWESKARKAERQLREVRDSTRNGASLLGNSTATTTGSLITFEKALAQKDQIITSLQAKLNASSLEMRPSSDSDRRNSPSGSPSSIRVHLTAERVRVIELEEELSAKKDELRKLNRERTKHHSTVLAKESELQHLRHELEMQKRSSDQQKKLVMSQRQAMLEKDSHLASLVRALEKEKKLADQLRRRSSQSGYSTPKVADLSMPVDLTLSTCLTKLEHNSLFDLVSGRHICTVEMMRPSGITTELGFSYARTELPISSKLTCLIVKSVERSSLAFGKLQPGDEILEVNGHACRGGDNKTVIECLEMGTGIIKMVLARDKDLCLQVQAHSTPLKPSGPWSDQTTLWATAVSTQSDTMFPSFATSSSIPLEASTAEYLSVPTTPQSSLEVPLGNSVATAVQPNFSSTMSVLDERSQGVASCMKAEEKPYEEGVRQDLQTEVNELHEQLDVSEQLQLELDGEVEALRSELDNLQAKFDSTKTENTQLKEKAASHDGEVADIQQHVREMQAMLVKLENQVADDHQRIASLENHNKGLSNELIEARLLSDTSVKDKVEIENKLNRLREEMVIKVDAERKRDEEFQHLLSEKDRLSADLEIRNARVNVLTAQLEKKTTELQQVKLEAEGNSKQLLSEISLLKETTVKTSSSAQQEQEHLQTQFTSAKNLLMEAQMKETQQKVEMKYLKQAADLANEQLKECEEKSRKLEGELAVFKQLVETKTLEMESLILGLKATQHKLEAKQEMQSRLQNEVDSLRRNCAKIQNEKTHTMEAMTNMRSSLKAAEAEVVRLEKKLDTSVDEKDTLFQQLEETVSDNTQFQLELDKLQNSLEEAVATKERGKELLAKNERLMEEKKTLEEELAKQTDRFNAEKKVLESELSQTRSESLSASSSVQEHLSRLEEEIKQQRDKLVSCEGEKAKLSHSCDKYKNRESELLEQIQSLKSEKESIASELKTVNTQKEDAFRDLDASQKKVQNLNQQCLSIKKERQTAEAASETLSKQLNDSTSEVERLTTNREELLQQLKGLQEHLDQARSEFDCKNHDYEELNATYNQLREKSKIEQTKFEELRASVATLNDWNAKLQAEKKRTDDMVASMEFMYQQNQTTLEQAADTVKLKESEVTTLKSELDKTTANLKKERTLAAGLKESLSTVKEELEKSESRRHKEVVELKEQLSVYMKDVGGLQEQLQTEKSSSAGHKSLITQLKSNIKEANKERHILRSELEAVLKQKEELKAENSQLEGQLAKLQSEVMQLEDSGNFLSSESASLKLHLKQSSRETDELTAQLQAVEMNLEVANRTLDESERERLEWVSERESMELQLGDLKTALQESQSNLEQMTIQLHTCDEELSKVKSTLGLRQRECKELQESLISAKTNAQNYEKNIAQLESEKTNIQASFELIGKEQEHLKISLLMLEREKQDESLRFQSEKEALQKQCNDLSAKVDSYSNRTQKLERSKQESEETVTQLLAAQEAFKNSLSLLGDEKDVEIMKLQGQVSKFVNELGETRQQLEQSRSREAETEKKHRQLERGHQMTLESCTSLENENQSLKEITKKHKKTSDQLSELNSKMTTLQEALRMKTEKVSEMEHSLLEATSQLQVTCAENERLLGKISELARVKVSLVEKSAEMDKFRRQLALTTKQCKELTDERDHLLTTLRKLEVEKHSAAVKQATPELPRSPEVSKEELLSLLRDKEEEATKLKEYVAKLLSTVVERAPFVLENI